jgi:serine/threonine-protein kinase RsbW
MDDLNVEKILGVVAAADFVGRSDEMETLIRFARGENGGKQKFSGFALSSAPALGASKLLRQIYDRLSADESAGGTAPVYFALKKSDETARQAAARFAQTFLRQTIDFHRRRRRRSNANFLNDAFAAPNSNEIVEQASGERAFITNCLSIPLFFAAANKEENTDFFVMFDDLHEVDFLIDGALFLEELKEIYGRARENVRFVFAGHRRFLFGAVKSGGGAAQNLETLELKPFDFAHAGRLAENLAEKYAVETGEQTRDLIAVQTAGNPLFIENLFGAAHERKTNFDSFRRVQQIYADEIFGGGIAKFYDAILAKITTSPEIQRNVVGLLYDALTVENEKAPLESWKARSGFATDEEFYRAARLLNTYEIVRLSSNLIEATNENEILTDYIKARFRLETSNEPRALVVGETMSEFLKRAPQTMARFYRKSSSIGLRGLLSAFACQKIPAALLDYSVFADQLKGVSEKEILKRLAAVADTEKIDLPQIIYTAHAEAFYPPISQLVERERAAVAVGFNECKYTDDDQTVWIAAEIDSKLEAAGEVAEFWCDRLEMVALVCNFLEYKIWLVAPEGFSPDALETLRQRNAIGSSRRQAELLANFLSIENDKPDEKTRADEFEIVVPVGEDGELIAAHALEEIARRHSFTPKAINQIKTALVEACINAAEHSLSPDGKIYQKFTVEKDKIIITIANRGLRLADKKAVEITPENGRRGWGLKLMRTLMDEVKFEQVDDGTRISMVKNK